MKSETHTARQPQYLGLVAGAVTVVSPPVNTLGAVPFHRLEALGAAEATQLLKIARRIIPLEGVSEDAFLAIVAAYDVQSQRDAAVAELLRKGLGDIASQLGDEWVSGPTSALDRCLQSIQSRPFFKHLYTTAIPVFFGQHEIWKRLT